jgi:hypothetical protein
VTGTFDSAAEALRKTETARLTAATLPTIDGLRALNANQLRLRVSTMLGYLGYELLTPGAAGDLIAMKDGAKFIVAFGSTTDQAPIAIPPLTRLHGAIIAASAAGGFYVTTRGFTRDAEAFAATAPIKLVDGPKLIASIKRSMAGTPPADSYKAMCRQCGEIVTHKLDRAEAVPCSSGHAVPPTIARALLSIHRQEGGSTSRTYTQPRVYTRREVNAHNGKYIARKKRQNRPALQEPAADHDAAPDPFTAD